MTVAFAEDDGMIPDFELGRLSLFLQTNLDVEQMALLESQCPIAAHALGLESMIDGVSGPTAKMIMAMGHGINTIKELRAATGMGLKEAKEWVDEHCPKG